MAGHRRNPREYWVVHSWFPLVSIEIIDWNLKCRTKQCRWNGEKRKKVASRGEWEEMRRWSMTISSQHVWGRENVGQMNYAGATHFGHNKLIFFVIIKILWSLGSSNTILIQLKRKGIAMFLSSAHARTHTQSNRGKNTISLMILLQLFLQEDNSLVCVNFSN